ncbi:MAG TPA: NAD(P)H-dependent glycerol-3-phosphate dehydrogenase [Opitutales bacterium]|jgi:glycerol-3-phosphate dehydrogenase (NAD(P)+)|nr:NAD(P)H-dependent glycerol-3-phosphate dehydrogenase [Opitutales bacterium]
MNVTLFGAGAWGTALALHCARAGQTVTLVPRRMEHALELAASRENREYLPGYPLPPSLQIGLEIRPALMEADIVLLACPLRGLRTLVQSLNAQMDAAWAKPMFIALCKGMENDTFQLPCAIIAGEIPGAETAVLSGPSHAAEVAAGQPTAVVLASQAAEDRARRVQAVLSSPTLRVYRSRDVIGVEAAAALKNIYAIGAGLCDGLGLGDNAKAAYLTRALHEMTLLGVRLGGQTATFYGLGGFGDFVATCNGRWSRNRTFGEDIARGQPPESLLCGRHTVVEGYAATAAFAALCAREKIDAPILAEIHALLYAGRNPRDTIQRLMGRELKVED